MTLKSETKFALISKTQGSITIVIHRGNARVVIRTNKEPLGLTLEEEWEFLTSEGWKPK
jgi:hypothetical protein